MTMSAKKLTTGGQGSRDNIEIVISSDDETVCYDVSPVLSRIGNFGLKKRRSKDVVVITLDDINRRKDLADDITVKLEIHPPFKSFAPVKGTYANSFETYTISDDSDVEIMESKFGESVVDPENVNVNLPSQNKRELESYSVMDEFVKDLKDNCNQFGINLSPPQTIKEPESGKTNEERLDSTPTTSSASNAIKDKEVCQHKIGCCIANSNQNQSVNLETFGFVCANLLAASAKRSQEKLQKTMLKYASERLDLKKGGEEEFRNLIQMSKEFTNIIEKRDTVFINPLSRSKRKRSCPSESNNSEQIDKAENTNRKDAEKCDVESQSSSGIDKNVPIKSNVLSNDGNDKAGVTDPKDVEICDVESQSSSATDKSVVILSNTLDDNNDKAGDANPKDVENCDVESQASSGTDKSVQIISNVLLNDGKRKASDLSPENVKKPRNVSYDQTRPTRQDSDLGVWFPKLVDLTLNEDVVQWPPLPEWLKNNAEPQRKRCFFCSKEVFNLRLHIEKRHATAKEMCEVCGKTYNMKTSKTDHIMRCHYDYYLQKLTENQK